jgi:hypothetical protein
MKLEGISEKSVPCPCGCGNNMALFTGMLLYGQDNRVAVMAAHFAHCPDGPSMWLQLGSGAWFAGDGRDCWTTLHMWVRDKEVVTRIEEPQDSPFWVNRDESSRYLTRDEVLSRQGGRDWAIDRRLVSARNEN